MHMDLRTIIHKIVQAVLVYYVLVVFSFCNTSDTSNTNHCNDPKNKYVPKAQRVRSNMLPSVTKWFGNMYHLMQQKYYIWEADNPMNEFRRRQKIARDTQSKNIKRGRFSKILAITAMAMQAKGAVGTSAAHIAQFDTDSEEIGIDNRCSACISHKIEDFIDVPSPINRTIRGFGGTTTRNVMKGTIRWKWLDDEGTPHSFRIPNSYYVPDGSVRLLSPQHWAKTQVGNNRKLFSGTGSKTTCDTVKLFWNQKQNVLTVPINKRNNVATFYMAPGFARFKLFCSQAEIEYDREQSYPLEASDAQHTVTDDEGDKPISFEHVDNART